MTTNLNKIKETAKQLLYAVPVEPIIIEEKIFPICSHPFTNSTTMVINKNFINITQNKRDFYKYIGDKINNAKDLGEIYRLINNPYKLTFFKYISNFLSEKDYANYLENVWISQENPNMDINCPPKESVKLFRKANKEYLMNKEDYEVYKNFPEEMVVYRGVGIGRTPAGLSWTVNLEKAEWFAHRFDTENEKGYIQKLTVKKENILAYFNTRGEDEVVVDIFKSPKIKRI
jgi:hypothetical protein